MREIIISYRRKDSDAITGRIRDRIGERFGETAIFMDIDSIPLGFDFRDYIQDALRHTQLMLAVVGPNWIGAVESGQARIFEEADPVRIEVESALRNGVPVIPVLVGGAHMPQASELPESLKKFPFLNAAEVSSGLDFRTHVDRLTQAIAGILQQKGLTKEPEPVRPAAGLVQRIWPLAATAVAVAAVVGGAGFAFRDMIFRGAPQADAEAPWAVPADTNKALTRADTQRNQAETDPQALRRLTALAEAGDPNDEFSLGTLYDPDFKLSKIVAPDINQTMMWYLRASEQGHKVAQENYAYKFYMGQWVPQDYPKAVYWFERAAAQGESYAQRLLGQCYQNGQGVPANRAIALEWYQRAATAGDSISQSVIGDAYASGNGFERNQLEALNWYRKASAQGYAYAQMRIGEAYLNGNGVARDPQQALGFLQQSANSGNAEAQFYLGAMYDQGLGVTEDPVKAAEWYLKGAQGGNSDAENAIGLAYANGRGVQRNVKEARLWLEKAKAAGNSAAANNLKYLR